MAFGGVLLKGSSTFLRVLELLGSVAVFGIYTWFLVYGSARHLPIYRSTKAVEGISGAAIIYTAFAVILTCFLAGFTWAAGLSIILDVGFIGGFIAVAYLSRAGRNVCRSARVVTPIGTGSGLVDGFFVTGTDGTRSKANLYAACKLEKAVYIIAIILVVLFIIQLIYDVALMHHHRRERAYGPSPSNNYTAGSGRRFGFVGRRKNRTTRDAELATVGAGDKVGANGYRGN